MSGSCSDGSRNGGRGSVVDGSVVKRDLLLATLKVVMIAMEVDYR